jgi:hypothetical protein
VCDSVLDHTSLDHTGPDHVSRARAGRPDPADLRARPDRRSAGLRLPGLARTYVRPDTTLSPGHLPKTASAFGGVPEPNLFGYQIMTTW